MTEQLPHNKNLNLIVEHRRRNISLVEALLWHELRHKQLGFEFIIKAPIESFIVDFYCPELSLIIELDDLSPFVPQALKARQAKKMALEALGFHYLEIKERTIGRDMSLVLDQIARKIASISS